MSAEDTLDRLKDLKTQQRKLEEQAKSEDLEGQLRISIRIIPIKKQIEAIRLTGIWDEAIRINRGAMQ